ncbi:D-amino acid dehydrogenase [Pseudomonas gingeri]|uniref:D-amino acid dehydrogenase n=1 Tax=Pseudomonas gingeri TaxID=117681 RepID=UPI0015A29C43|nr:D-amino acid dehydrogenase [Pseudomonas gingeri]NVZ66662.1 D-amino acid dehydrogenase [Pseudomonas gingeri]NVZ74751.1 D-amino acid dehydrogenase [Pseudomonas gingeri]
MKICVVGAGIVGLSSAWFLHRAGHRVTVVDQASGPGMGAVAGNGAQLSYSYVQPLADPSLLPGIPKLLLDRSGPLRFTPQWSPEQWRWCMEFLAACRTSVSRQTTVELLALATESRQALDGFMQEQQLDCDFTRTGKLVLYPDAESLDKAQHQLRFQAGLGSRQQAVSASEAVAIEPALAGYRSAFHGAIHTDSECAVDGLKLCREMARIMADEGVQLLFGRKVEGFRRQGRLITALNLRHAREGAEVLHCEAVVLAAGAHTTGLLAQLGSRLPVYPLKGYSITLPITGHTRAPTVSITDMRRKTVFARIGDRLRVAGMVELCGMDASIPPARIEQLQASTEALFGGGWYIGDRQPWTGWRPATPTGRPVLECPAGSNLYLNTGHGALGMTLAFGSAQRLVRLVEHTTH